MPRSDYLRYTKFPLNDGINVIPALGIGTLITEAHETRKAIKGALEVGFRLIDCAERYRNEAEVGEMLREIFRSRLVKRDEVFVVSKLWNNNHRYERVKPAFEASLKRLQLDYLDLYLIHTPFAFKPGDDPEPRDEHGRLVYDKKVTLMETWRAMESLVDSGKCRAIGLSDIGLGEFKEIYEEARIKPAVLHVESHPYLPQWDLVNYCKKTGVVLQAFAPLGHGIEPRLLDDPVIDAVAYLVKKTPAQVLLAWAVQRGTALLTTSTSSGHLRENFEISTLPEDAMKEIAEGITTRCRFNTVVESGVPGFIARGH